MRKYTKNIGMAVCIFTVLMLAACEKDKLNTNQQSDLLAGTYYSVDTQYNGTSVTGSGRDTLIVLHTSTDTASVIVNGTIYTGPQMQSDGSKLYQTWYTQTNNPAIGYYIIVSFPPGGQKIYMQWGYDENQVFYVTEVLSGHK